MYVYTYNSVYKVDYRGAAAPKNTNLYRLKVLRKILGEGVCTKK